jgi:hypothetical protein
MLNHYFISRKIYTFAKQSMQNYVIISDPESQIYNY